MNIIKISLIGSILVLNSCNKQTAGEKAQNDEAIEDVHNAIKEMQSDNKKELEQNGVVDTHSDQLDKIITATDKLKDGHTEEAKMYQIIGKHMKVMQAKMKHFENEQVGLEDALDLSTLKEKNDVDVRIKALDRAIRANEEFKKYAAGDYYDNIIAEIEGTDISSASKREFRKGFEGGGKKNRQVALVKIVRDSEIEVCKLFKKQLNLLGDNMDKWSWDADTEQVIISDADMENQYNTYGDALQVAAQKQMQAQKEAIENQ